MLTEYYITCCTLATDNVFLLNASIFFRFSFEKSKVILLFVVYVSECFKKVMLSKSCRVCLWEFICFKSIFSLLSERFNVVCSQQFNFKYNTYRFYNNSLGLLQKLVGNILHATKRDCVCGNTRARYDLRYVYHRELTVEGRGDNNGHQRCFCLRIWENWGKFVKVVGGFFKEFFVFPSFLQFFFFCRMTESVLEELHITIGQSCALFQ